LGEGYFHWGEGRFSRYYLKNEQKLSEKKTVISTESKDQRKNLKRTQIIHIWGGMPRSQQSALYAKVRPFFPILKERFLKHQEHLIRIRKYFKSI
jgi:hypothetical protein